MFICRYQFRSSAEKRKIVFEEFMSRVAGNCEMHSINMLLQFSEEIALTNFPRTRLRDLTKLECAKIAENKHDYLRHLWAFTLMIRFITSAVY